MPQKYIANNKMLIHYLYSIKYPKSALYLFPAIDTIYGTCICVCESEKHLFERILCEPIHRLVSYHTQPSIKYKRMLLCYYNRKMED